MIIYIWKLVNKGTQQKSKIRMVPRNSSESRHTQKQTHTHTQSTFKTHVLIIRLEKYIYFILLITFVKFKNIDVFNLNFYILHKNLMIFNVNFCKVLKVMFYSKLTFKNSKKIYRY